MLFLSSLQETSEAAEYSRSVMRPIVRRHLRSGLSGTL